MSPLLVETERPLREIVAVVAAAAAVACCFVWFVLLLGSLFCWFIGLSVGSSAGSFGSPGRSVGPLVRLFV